VKVSASLPTGVAALFFDSARRHRELEGRLVKRLMDHGFDEVILPVVDYLDPYEEMPSGVRRDELYRFVDRDGQVLALRSDFTTMLARLIAPRLATLELPLKLFYRGDVLRYQQDRAGRQREFYQLGGEVLGAVGGEDGGEDGERAVLTEFLDLLAATGRRPLLVVLGFAGALDGLLLGFKGRLAYAAAAVVRRERRAFRDGAEALLQVVESGMPADVAALGEEAGARLGRLTALAGELAERFPRIAVRVDLAEFGDQVVAPELRRRLARRPYYDGLVFRAFAGRAAEPVGGGGRYDRLFQRLGVTATASGFSLSLDRLWEAETREDEA
jgi:ATP phosphoribosyltransferase regulatory subunit